MSENEPGKPESPASETKPGIGPVTKSTRRLSANNSGSRRAGGGESKISPVVGPAKPDTAKMVALAVCGVLFVACVGLLLYILVLKPKPVAKKPNEKLDSTALVLAEKSKRAAKLYEDGKAKAGSDKLEELTESERNLFSALNLFNEVADEYKTVPGYEDSIKLAHDKRQVIDAELKVVRDKKTKLELEADNIRREKAKAAQPATPTATVNTAVVVPTPNAGKEPTDEELSDKNLDKLFTDDPSEYEKLAKIREKRDPNFKMKKP